MIHGKKLRKCENGNYHIQVIDFGQSYSTVTHYDSFMINTSISDMHRITARILDIINALQNTNFPIHENICQSTPILSVTD